MRHRLPAHLRAALAATRAMTAAAMLSLALATGIAAAFTNSDALVARGFATALEVADTGDGATPRKAGPLVSGSEEFWLTRARTDSARAHIEPVAWPQPAELLGVAAGDRITVASQGSERTLEVIAVSEVDANVTRIETGSASSRQLMITCRDISASDGRVVRFLTEAPAATKPARAL